MDSEALGIVEVDETPPPLVLTPDEVGALAVDHHLFLPEEWFDNQHRERWEKCGIPDGTTHQTKPELALQMLQAVAAHAAQSLQANPADPEAEPCCLPVAS